MTNAEARFNKSLRPRKPEGSLGRTAQDVHLDSHTAPELCNWLCGKKKLFIARFWMSTEAATLTAAVSASSSTTPAALIPNYHVAGIAVSVSANPPANSCLTRTNWGAYVIFLHANTHRGLRFNYSHPKDFQTCSQSQCTGRSVQAEFQWLCRDGNPVRIGAKPA